jgi:hypothetical protein
MTAFLVSPTLVALAALAAHFWRAGNFALAAAAIAIAALVAVRRPWAARVLQAALALGALEWLRTLAALVADRQSMGLPYLRLALILGAIAAVTALAALAFELRPLRARYRLR